MRTHRFLGLFAGLVLAQGCVIDGSDKCEAQGCDGSTGGEVTSGSGSTGTTGGTAEPPDPTEATGGSSGAAPVGCEGDFPRVRLETSMGDMVVMLDALHVPNTAANFIKYVEADFYAGTIFHRVIDGFVVQGGGFTEAGQEKPTAPPIPLEIVPGAKHVDGAIAMARTNEPDSATAQFYLCDGAQPGLDGNYAVFGVLVEGFEVLQAISAVMTDANDTPVENVVILSATCE